MIKDFIIITAISYLSIAVAWYFIFTYQFTFKMTVNVAGETLQKDFKGFELFLICLLWIFLMPVAIKQMRKNDEEE